MKTALLALFALLKPPFVRLTSSMKFWTLILGVTTTQAAKYGFEVDEGTYWTIVGFFGVLLGAQGLNDHGKGKAETLTKAAKESRQQLGFAVYETMALMLMLACIVIPLAASCTGRSAVQHAGAFVANTVACTTPEATNAIRAFKPAFSTVVRSATAPDGHVDWTPIGDTAQSLKTAAERCAFAAAVKEALAGVAELVGAPQSSPAALDRESLRAGWESQRAAWGGATYQLPGGAL